jgi:hypothetical protein
MATSSETTVVASASPFIRFTIVAQAIQGGTVMIQLEAGRLRAGRAKILLAPTRMAWR